MVGLIGLIWLIGRAGVVTEEGEPGGEAEGGGEGWECGEERLHGYVDEVCGDDCEEGPERCFEAWFVEGTAYGYSCEYRVEAEEAVGDERGVGVENKCHCQ